MVGIPLVLDLIFIWGPAIASIIFSFTQWNGVHGLAAKDWVGLGEYQKLGLPFGPNYEAFWEAVKHNLIWFLVLMFVATPIGMFFAVLLDRQLRGGSFYQTIFYMPVVLSLAVVGLIWELQYSQDNGLLDSLLRVVHISPVDWLGDPKINLWAALVAASWRHVGYIMVLYLAGLKSVDPSLREAAAIDGANGVETYIHVVFWVMMPINTVIVVVTSIEALRAFDIAWMINHGKNGLELLGTVITNASVSEANLIGFGSAVATVLLVVSLVPIVTFLLRITREEAQ